MLSLTKARYVLSTTHLHEFKSPDRISSQAPIMSLPLTDQKLGSHSSADSSSHKFMLKGRQSGGMHRGHAWVFRAESYDTMLAWFSDIKNLTEKTGAERKEFIRRSHARSISAGSHKAGSISSDGGMDEDEADEVPYSATASQTEIPSQGEKFPQRPNPGGRFPSALKINRDSRVPISPSSPSRSTGDREIVAAAGALPGSDAPLGSFGQQMQTGDDWADATRGELDGTSTAPLAVDSYPAVGSNLATAPGAKDRDSPEQNQSVDSSTDPDSVPHLQQGDEALGADGIEAYRRGRKQRGLAAHVDQLGIQTTPPAIQGSAPIPQQSGQARVSGAIFTEFPSTCSGTNDNAKQSNSPIEREPTSHASGPAPHIHDLASRPSLGNRVATISELHVPGEFPKGQFLTMS